MSSKSKSEVIEELAQLKHVGEVRATLLYEQLKIRSTQQLIQAAREHRLQEITGIAEKTEASILRAAERVVAAGVADQGRRGARVVNSPDGLLRVTREREAPAAEPAQPQVAAPPADEVAEQAPQQALPEPEPVAVTGVARLLEVLVCPNCGHDGFSQLGVALRCEACRREYSFTRGLADLAPPHYHTGGLAQRVMETRLYARLYEDVMRPRLTGVVTARTLSEEYALAAQWLALEPGLSLLDVACGTGNFTRVFAQRMRAREGRQPSLVVGVDLSWPMLEHAQQYLKRDGLSDGVFLVRGDASRLPLGRATFDRLHCAGALHLMSEPDEALRNFARVLKPGGLCVIGTFIRGRGVLRQLLKRVSEPISQFRWFSERDLHERLSRAGFVLEDQSIQGDALTLRARRA